ncbi:twin-arginine translocase TatA/TatE family subunit [Halobaculum halobium]|uniref:Twin-arginine translocase TatA/TatE family subunit n=1 Tax=Halobaculum halobium TaxID=3032281 RepID=A0ABD5THV0_9EURY|nr:twin-arginine translocase TatA/TatE family subunit [Halobaculum sp. SYNS20]
MVPLFGGVPGGPELLIILLILLLLFGGTAVLVLVLGVGGLKLFGGADRGDGRVDDDRVATLERDLAETRRELAELREDQDPEVGTDPATGQRNDAGDSSDATVGDATAEDDYDESRSA